jgi:hypothetical protein
MQALPTVTGVQSLRSITARSSSARVLDLHSLALEEVQNEAHQLRPMFVHPVLNRTIIVKHHPRPGEFEYASERGAIVTKVIFPFDPDDLDLGGQFLLIDGPELPAQLTRQLDYSGIDPERDLTVLQLLGKLPTLDPFLLHEALCANRFDVAPCYFRLSPADKSEMRDFVAHQVETLIGLCFGETTSGAKSKRLSELILTADDGPELDPLRQAMRMGEEQFSQAMFCWKAVLYYRWRSRVLWPDVKATRHSIAGLDTNGFDPDSGRFARTAIAELEALMGDCERRIAEMFRIYDEVFEALTQSRAPDPFRRFLSDGPRLFARLGERMGRLEQLVSYWQHQFPGRRTRHLSPEAIVDGLRNLTAALSLGGGRAGDDQPRSERVWGTQVVRARPVIKRKTLKAVG